MKKPTDRIPFEAWANSYLSLAEHYGLCIINGKTYVFDPDTKQEEN